MVPTAVRLLDAAGIELADFAVRRPTLDDVFLALTGHAAEMVRRVTTITPGKTSRPTPSSRTPWR